MSPIRVLACSLALVIALTPMAAVAQSTEEHLQAELANAAAQYQLALQQAEEIQTQAQMSAANERAMALLDSEMFRQRQLEVTSNGFAIEQIGRALANAIRQEGDLDARNELAIAQIRAGVLVAKADATLANALAQQRPAEIANARAQSQFLRHLADTISGVMAEQNMSSAKLNAEMRAGEANAHGITEATNGVALGANSLLAGDLAFAAGALAAISSTEGAKPKAAAIVQHAAASLNNQQVKLAEATD
jgi:hypothetical protein